VNPPRAVDALVVGAVKLAVSAFVLGAGFRAVSDDDYARIVIAQRFAEAPALDPSGTSWLPLPFWTYGSVFALFGNELGVARAIALVLGVAASLLVLVSARWLGANRTGALLAALVASVVPWSAWLGAAVLPEAPTAGLVLLGISALSHPDPRRRTIGASAIALACFSRYEAWPVAAVFCFFSAVDARRLRSWSLAVPAFVAALPIALWLAHGVVQHGDALFFWKRVASYKHALGSEPTPLLAFLEPWIALVREQPLLLLMVAFALVHRFRSEQRAFAPYARGIACSCALVLFLSVGALGGGTPTHHAARALLPVWYFLATVLGHAAGSWLEARPSRRPLVAVAVIPFLGRLAMSPVPADFAHRELELHIGDRAKRLGAPMLLVDTPDFGYFAVAAAFGLPGASAPLDDRDPRKSRAADPFASPVALLARLERMPKAWLVTTDAHVPLAQTTGTVRAQNARFALVEPRQSPK
jgi:hypothetical protein